MKQNFSCWGRRTGLLARAVLLSLAAGFLAGNAQAADFTKPITGNTDADYAEVKSGLTYTFTGDNTITPDTQYYQAGIDYSKYASGSTLTVNSTGKLSMNVSGEHQMMLNGIMNKSPNTMNINGDIDVKVNNTKDSGKSYGIYAWNTKGAKVDIIGNADISASAKNIAHGVDISSAGGWIDLEGKSGGTIRITADKIAKDSAAVSATGDSTWVNINYDRGSIRHEDAKVQINGDLYTRKVPQSETEYSTGESGTIYLGLAGKDSYLHGVMGYRADQSYDDYDESGTNYYSGDVRLLMKHGASWTNEAYASHTGEEWKSWAGSKAAYLESDGGVIYQKDTHPITIDSYKGNVTVVYDHDATDPAKFSAGDITINRAQSGSTVAMLTSSTGLSFDPKTDKTSAAKVLSALAQKLYYNGTSGNLTGTVAIASGLTSSTYQVSGPIQFSTDTTGTKKAGQGYYDASADKPDTPSGDLKTGPITTSENIGETRQADANGTVNVYVDTVPEYFPDTSSALYVDDTVRVSNEKDPMIVDLQGHQLNLKVAPNDDEWADVATGAYIDPKEYVVIKDSNNKGSMHISVGTDPNGTVVTMPRYAYGIDVKGNGNLDVRTGMSIEGVTTKPGRLKGLAGVYVGNGGKASFQKLTISNIESSKDTSGKASGIYTAGGNITISDDLNISNISGSALRILDGGIVTISGGTITTPKMSDSLPNKFIYAVNNTKGTVNLNTGDVTSAGILSITGDIKLYDDEASVVNMNLTDKSEWTGASIINLSSQYNDPSAHMNLMLQKGGKWTHETGLSSDTIASEFSGSRISKLEGYGGSIYQNSDKPITVYNYSGDTTVVYKHDSTDPTKINGGDFTVKSAEANSRITLVTGSEGITSGFKDTDSGKDRNTVSAVLNKLANKLFYSNYAKDKNLSGTVRIAEGLTSSSATAKVGKEGAITFSDGTKEGTTAGQGYYDYTPASEVTYKTGPITESEQISKTRDDGGTGTVTVKNSVAKSMDGSNYVSALYAKDAHNGASRDNPMVVDMDGRNLVLDAESDDRQAAAIYVTDNAHIDVKNSSTDKKLSITAANTARTAANGILVKGSYGDLSIQGPMEIKNITTEGSSASGITVNGKNSEVHMDGPLTIAGVEGKSTRGMGIGTVGVGIVGDSSKVTVNGNVDITGVTGSSLKTSGADAEISVGGGTITAAEDGEKNHNYYAARVDKGTININMKDGKAGSSTTKITGDMYATGQYGKRVVEYSGGELVDWTNAGKLNVALTDSSSFWTGVAAYDQYNDDYGTGGNTMHDIGEVNLYLQNGATWTNEQQSHVTTTTLGKDQQVWKGSQLATLHGSSDSSHAGIIYQKDTNPITVLDYSGMTKVFYSHDESDPKNIIGGDFKITKAEEGSQIELITDSKGINAGFNDSDGEADKTLVADVLDKLANKLYYSGYADGHLTGTVKIASGLTASSAEMKTGKISFSDGTNGTKTAGQGFYDYVKLPESQTDTEFTDTITGVREKDQKYVNTGVLKDNGEHYVFTKDTTITAANTINVGDVDHAVDINAKGHTLTLVSDSTSKKPVSAVEVNSINGVTISADKLVIRASDNGRIEALRIGGQGQQNADHPNKLTINGDVDMLVHGSNYSLGLYMAGNSDVTFNGNITAMGDKDNAWGLTSKYGAYGYYGVSLVYSGSNYALQTGPKVTINGDVNAKIDGNSLFANGGHAKLTINGGGNIEINKDNTHNYYAMIAECGTTSMNVKLDENYNATGAGTNKLVLKGNISASTGAINDAEPEQWTNVNLGLATKDSEWTGVAYNKFKDDGSVPSGGTKKFYGAINLFLQNGATWNNEEWGAVEKNAWGGQPFTGSHLAKLVGGDSAANAGIINQNDSRDIRVDNYSGNTVVVYKHEIVDDTTRNNADLYGNKSASITGGSFKITNAEAGSAVTLVTDRTGLDLDSKTYTDKNLVNDTFDKLANKLIYAGYADKNLTGKVSIAEGLTAASLTKSLAGGDISWYDGSKEGTTAGEGYYDYKLTYPDSQTTDSYSEAITGDSSVDKVYVETGVLKDGTHTYSFTKPSTTITVGKTLIGGGMWMPRISAAVSGGGEGHEADLDLHGNSMTIKTTSDTHTTGITAIGKGIVDVANAGKISVNAESTIGGQTAAIFVNNGGTVRIHNGGSNATDKVLTLRAKGANSANVAVIKAMNGMEGVQSAVAIDGLVDILADGKDGSSEAVSAVASKVDIGGGTIKAINDAAYAIRGYGEFRSSNKAIVNVNVQKDKDGNVIGAGANNTVIEGNIFLGGSMDVDGERAEVNIGLNTKDSYFKGDIANPNASSTGHVNLYMGNGASWTGNNLSGSTVTAHLDSDAFWTGYSTGNAMNLDMNGTGLWNNTGTSSVASITGKGGLINMSGDKAGTVSVKQYGGNATLLYRHEIADDSTRAHADLYGDKAASIIGGDFKITDAAAGSTITLVTDSTGVSTTSTAYTDKNLVNDLLDKLANKLYYSGYADGNLKGYVRIAEGLTSSSITAKLRQEDVSFYNADEAKTAGMTEGQGHYSYSLAYPDEQVKDPMSTVIDGSSESKDTYRDAGIYKDNTDSYDFTKKPATVNSDGKSDSIIHAGDNDVNVKTNDVLNINAKDGGIGMKAENGKTVTTTGNTSITAKDGTGILADKGTVKLANDTAINGATGMEAKNGGTITAEGKTDITATGNALHADGDGSTIALKDGTISGAVLAENKGTITTSGAALKGDVKAASDGTVALTNGSTAEGITADGGTITTDGTEVGGLISAKNGGKASMRNGSAKGLSADKDSAVTAVLDKADAKLDGNVANEGTASISLSNGASWTGDSTGTGTTTANIGSGSTWTGASSNGNTSVALEGTWKQTGASTVDTLTGKGGILDKSADGAGETKIASYSGDMSILYSHNASTPTEINGAVTTVGQAADGSSISLITDSKGLSMDSKKADDKNTVSETLNQLAHKLHYTANDGKLNGKLKIAEGLTSSSAAIRAEDITFDKDGIGTFTYDPAKDHDIHIEYGSEETRMMKGTKSALLGSAMMWRSNNNDIQRRMGDLRLGQGETGVWARYMGGKNKYDQQNTYLNQDYDIGQAGFDKKVGDWTVGLAIDHGDGKSHYIGGRGKEKMNTLAIYGTRVSNDGRYFDVIVKTGQVKNKFDVSNEIGNRLHGDYKAWGNSISLEYGKRFVQDSGFYLDPSVEFTAGRLNGKNFTGTSDLGTLYVHQHGFNSAIGRIGFSIGRQLPKSNLYAKLALAHEFAGDFKTDFYADDGGLKSTKVDLSDTWLDMELGGSLSLGKNVYLYGTYTRTFEADMATKWRADVGVRYTF
nr:hypothetical protein [uncultured Dialister sp.]